ncbi:MAG: dephospho-CoA kinase [Pseudomonadota bacterium]
MIRFGLTGSIGMGKSTTAEMFAEAGVPVWDADATVHRIYGPGGTGAAALRPLVPAAISETGGVDRMVLKTALAADPSLLKRVEAAVHPLVAADRARVLQEKATQGAPAVLLDIPLLFETGAEGTVDRVIVVSAPEAVQRARVLARGTMTEADLDRILARQLPDSEKRLRADYIIDTDQGFDGARAQVRQILKAEGIHA